MRIRALPAAALFCCALASAGPVRAAQSFDGCTGFIESVPATITSQGVWCLRRDLSTAVTGGSAITIASNNVTLDCNDFKLGGLAAGAASAAVGVYAYYRENTTIRRCNIRGFNRGVELYGGSGQLIEDNRFDNNLVYGILLNGEYQNVVRRNRVFDTGGHDPGPAGPRHATGIYAAGEVVDNHVEGLFAVNATNGTATGIFVTRLGISIRGNRVSRMLTTGTGWAQGIVAIDPGTHLEDNLVMRLGGGSADDIGIQGAVCTNNVVLGFGSGRPYLVQPHTGIVCAADQRGNVAD